MNRKKGIRNFLKSMKFRLICLFMLIGILTGILIRTGILTAYEKHAVSNRSVDVIGQAKILANQMVSTDYINGAESESITSQLQQMSRIYDGRILLIDSSFHIIKDTYDLDTDKTIISEEVIKSFRGEDSMNYDVDNHYVEMTIPLTTDNVESGEKSIIGVLLISVSTDSILANLEYMRNAALVLQIFGAVLLFAVSVFLSVRLTNPLKNMASSIAEIQNGYGTSDGELMIKDYSETVQISEKFNKLYSRMKMLDDSRPEFVSNVSHELKTPITSIRGYVELLESGMAQDPDTARDFLGRIKKEAMRMTNLVDDILMISRLESRGAKADIVTIRTVELLEDSLSSIAAQAASRGITVHKECENFTIRADLRQMQELFNNLLTNAVKYNNEGGEIWVQVKHWGADMILTVRDTGVGIPAESQGRIFERFYRVDKGRSRKQGGTGLGLSIVKHIVNFYHGSVKVESEVGKGSTFTVKLQIAEAK
mgnify:CR=1 FL=1